MIWFLSFRFRFLFGICMHLHFHFTFGNWFGNWQLAVGSWQWTWKLKGIGSLAHTSIPDSQDENYSDRSRYYTVHTIERPDADKRQGV